MAVNKDLKNIIKQIEKGIRESITGPAQKRLGQAAVLILQRRTRRGFGVKKSGGPRRRLKALKKSTIERRRRSKLSRFTSARKSNLTMTGQMLSALKAKSVKPGTIEISFDGRRRDGKSNLEIAEAVSKARPFLNFSGREIKALVEFYDTTLQATVTKALRGL